MSMPRNAAVTCPKCHNPFDVTIWDSVNTDLAPDLPKKIISGEFFDHKCPRCGFVCRVEYPTLYHDMKRGVMIWVVYQDEKYEARLKEIQKSMDKFSGLGYSYRIVHNISELREKVSIIESGRDDRVIECLKCVFWGQLANDCPEIEIDRVFYVSEGETEYFEIYDSEKAVMRCEVGEENYQQISALLQPLLAEDPLSREAIVGVDWAIRAMKKIDVYAECETEEDQQRCEQNADFRGGERQNDRPKDELQSGTRIDHMQTQKTSVRFCRKCGERLLETSKFCHKCGTAVVVQQPPAQNHNQPAQAAPRHVPSKQTSAPRMPQPIIKHDVKPVVRNPKRLFLGLVVVAIIVGIIFGTQSYWKAALFYDITFKGSEEITLEIGETEEITYNAEIGDLSKKDIQWETSDSSVATVSNSGIIKARGEGKATITASINGFKKDSCSVEVTLKTIPVKNGQMIKKPSWTGYPEVTVNAPQNANCFVYFKNLNHSTSDFAFYVKAGSSATVNAPTGTYVVYYVTGENWYGQELKFGQGSSFFKADDIFTLSEDDQSYDVLELTLYAVPDGNMDTDPISESDFPV